MKSRTQVTPAQFALTLLPISIGTIFFPAAGALVPLAGTAGWLAILIAFAISLIWLMMAVKLCRLAPTGNFATAAFSWLGPWVGRLLLLYLLTIGLWLGSLLLLQGSLVFHAIALPSTPPLALTLSTLVLLLVTDLKGIEVFLRTVQALILLAVPLLIGILWGTIPLTRTSNLLPIWGTGPAGIAHAAYLALPWAMDGTIFTLFLGPLVQNKKLLGRSALLVVILTGVSLAALVMVTVGVLGRGVTEAYVYPTAQLALNATLGGFLQGLELLFYPLWLMSAYVKSAALFLLASECVRGLVPALKQPWRTVLLATAFLIISLMPANGNQMIASVARLNNSVIAAFYGLLPLILLIAWRKRGKQNA